MAEDLLAIMVSSDAFLFTWASCLDAEVVANICKACKTWSKRDANSEEYQEWKLRYVCSMNYQESAGEMEAVGDVRIFHIYMYILYI